MTADEFRALKPCMLCYDVPKRRKIRNPSYRLRRVAFRINLSAWVIRCGDIPYSYLHSLAERGVKWRVVSFDASEAGNLVAMGIENIRQEIGDAIRRARRGANRSAERLGSHEIDSADYVATARVRIKRLRETLRDMEAAAQRFGITREQLSLGSAVAAVEAIDAGIKERCAAYSDAAKVIRRVHVSGGSAMAKAVESDTIPADILADYLEDQDTPDATRAAKRIRKSLFS